MSITDEHTGTILIDNALLRILDYHCETTGNALVSIVIRWLVLR